MHVYIYTCNIKLVTQPVFNEYNNKQRTEFIKLKFEKITTNLLQL